MRVMHFGICMLIIVGSMLLLLFDIVAGKQTRTSSTPNWVQVCTIKRVENHAELTCPEGYKEYYNNIKANVLATVAQTQVKCSAYPVYNVFNSIDVECK